MRAAVILKSNGEVVDADLDSKRDALDVLQEAVAGNVEVIGISHEFEMWINEEGKYQPGLERNLAATVMLHMAGGIPGDFIMGDVIFTSLPDDEGETQGLTHAARENLLALIDMIKHHADWESA